MNDKYYELEFKRIIYKLKINSENKDNIVFNYTKIINSNSCSINKKQLYSTLNNLLSCKFDLWIVNKSDTSNNKVLINQQIDDHMHFIDVIMFSSQLEKAIYQLAIILWNNKWIFNNNDYLELKLKRFFTKLFDKNEITKYIYFLLFNLESSTNKLEKNLDIDFDINIDDIDYELDNNNYLEFDEIDYDIIDLAFFKND